MPVVVEKCLRMLYWYITGFLSELL